MIAQLFLSFLLAIILLYAWTEYPRSPVIGLVRGARSVLGDFISCGSQRTPRFWRGSVGIGRGVDLIIYVWVVISLLVVFNLHLKLRSQMELITGLAREIALLKVHRPPIWTGPVVS